MWFFTWILGLGFAVLLALMNALWLEAQDAATANQSSEQNDGRSSPNKEA